MSSTGQIVGGIVGAIVGYFLGNPVLGASIGMGIGGAIDPPKGPKIEGPRLSDLSQQTSAYGLPIPRIYGNTAVFGNVFWIENNSLLEVSSSTGGGGKGGGGGGPQIKEYSYYVTFALGLCEGEIDGIGRVWCNGKLLIDFGSTDLQTNIVSNINANQITLYNGSATQQPNPRMQANLGINNTPAYRGLAYIVVEDFPLKDYGNTLAGAQFKVEVLTSQTLTQTRTYSLYHYPPIQNNSTFSPVPFFVSDKKIVWAVPNWDNNYPINSTYSLYTAYPDGTFTSDGEVQCTGQAVPPKIQSESEIYIYDGRQIFPYVPSGAISSAFSEGTGALYESKGIWIGYSLYNLAGIYDATLYVTGGTGPDIHLTIGEHFVAVTDGVYVYVVCNSFAAKYFINWSNGTLDLIYSGPGRPYTNIGVSKVTIDKHTGRLLWRQEPAVSSIYEYSDDLSTCSVYATTTIPNYYYSNYNWYSDGQILVSATGWCSSYPALADLNAEYYVFRIPTAIPVPLGDIVSSECQKSNILTTNDIDVTTLTDQVRGYTIATSGTLRSSIEPLRGAWPFDVSQAGYKIKFLRRGINPSIVTIPSSLLAATSKVGDTVPRLTQSREMDIQIPYRVIINYSDLNREYDVNSQYSERLVTASSNIATIEMPIVLTPDEAAQKCEILLYMYWLERIEFSFNLPPTYLYLEVSDIITIVEPPAAFVIRLTSIQYNNDGTLECRGRINNPTTYTSTAVGSNSGAAPAFRATIPLAGPVVVDLLDIPVIFDQNDISAFLVASSGISTYWAGANLYRTTDNGQTWTLINGFINESIIGKVTNAISAPSTFSLMDKGSVLVISMLGGNTLSSVTELQLLNGTNYFAYGSDKRWEIIAIQTIILQSDGSYYGYNILRGRFGTEWAASLHLPYDHLILLDTALIQQSLLSTNQITLGYKYRIVEAGADINDKTDISFAYMGNNLECLSPVYASGTINVPSTNDWTLNWIRRTRVGGELKDYTNALLSETAEAYEVDIFSNNTYTTIKRTITGLTTPTAVYTAAQQTTDFGSTQSQLYVGIYQVSSTVGRGYPLLTTIPTSGVY